MDKNRQPEDSNNHFNNISHIFSSYLQYPHQQQVLYMIKKKFWKIAFLSSAYIVALCFVSYAQELTKDYTGSITKYNSNFKGIGPKVYFVPPPKSRTEQLIDIFDSNMRKDYAKKIAQELRYKTLLTQVKSLPNIGRFQYLMKPEPTDLATWNELLNRIRQNYDDQVNLALVNEAGLFAINNNLPDQAISYFENAILIAAKESNKLDRIVLHQNLAAVLLYSGNFEKASAVAQENLNLAVQSKDYHDQANAWMLIALAKSGKKNYSEAEQNIIRKAIPLYNKAKAYEDKIIAWEQLAQVYFEQNKYTEAQWFLLQAQQLAENKKITNELPAIEYLLASSKLLDKNFKIAKKEFLSTLLLARERKNVPLELAVLDKLGEVYIHLKDFEEADKTYQNFTTLKATFKQVKDL